MEPYSHPARAKVIPLDPGTLTLSPETALEAPTAPEDTSKAVPFNVLDVKPGFNGGNAGEFSKWVNENLKYPKAAYEAGAQGRVTLQFVIGPDGKIGDVKVLRGVNPDLDAEALRVVSSSPDWTPGYVNGKPVKVTYTFPVIFKLNSDQGAPQTAQVGENGSITIKGSSLENVLVIVDGKEFAGGMEGLKDILPDTVHSIRVLKDESAVEKYGEKGRNGVVEVTLKKQQ